MEKSNGKDSILKGYVYQQSLVSNQLYHIGKILEWGGEVKLPQPKMNGILWCMVMIDWHARVSMLRFIYIHILPRMILYFITEKEKRKF